MLLKGWIDDGDAFELRIYLAKLPKKPATVVYLDSPGGNLREGLQARQFFYQNKIETVVDSMRSAPAPARWPSSAAAT